MTGTPQTGGGVDAAFREHERLLWWLVYRMTGSAADAEDVVQETFARALEHRPSQREGIRPWLVRVAMNLARDTLRRRRRRAYVGPWLPAPVETEDLPVEQRESVSYAFLVALEALTPTQRAVLLLRDVVDYSVKETAAALGLSEANVKTTLHRARRALQARRRGDAAVAAPSEAVRDALASLVECMATQDVARLEALLARDVRLVGDGGGEFAAARAPLEGRDRVLPFYLGLIRTRGLPRRLEVRELSGTTAVVCEMAEARPREAPRFVVLAELDTDGHIAALYHVLASEKLGGVRF